VGGVGEAEGVAGEVVGLEGEFVGVVVEDFGCEVGVVVVGEEVGFGVGESLEVGVGVIRGVSVGPGVDSVPAGKGFWLT
jgi:hypothetical protein